MEKMIINILRKLENKKLTIETETVNGGCIAMPAYIITMEYKGKTISAKSIELDEAFEKIMEQLEE